jgi:transposase InsO family protein
LEFKKKCMGLLAEGMTKVAVSEKHGVSEMSLIRWEKEFGHGQGTEKAEAVEKRKADAEEPRADEDGEVPGRERSRAPEDNIAGLSEEEVGEILKLKKEHFTMGPAQIRAQLKRFFGWRLSVKAIARVLKRNGYRVEHRAAKEEKDQGGFEAPRPNALWMMDALYFRVHDLRLYLHLVIDDFSRFIVGHRVSDEITSDEAVATLKGAISLHGKPERVLTDRGGQFLAVRESTSFRRYLEGELIDHSLSRPYHPQTLGKIESVNRAIQKELIYLHELGSADEAKEKIASWVEHYNFRRAHLGIDGLVPADRYFGLQGRVLSVVQARSRGRIAAPPNGDPIGGPLDDLGGPLEILRLVLWDGHLQLRFLGLKVVLGKAMA